MVVVSWSFGEVMNLQVKETGGHPVIVHGHGNHDLKPIFDKVRQSLLSEPPIKCTVPDDLTLITCNNGHPSLGLFEDTASRVGVPVEVCGSGRRSWVNAVDKPVVILKALSRIETEFTLYADSRDCLLVGSLVGALETFESSFSGRELVFGADIVNWPPVREFQKYEKDLAGNHTGRYRFLNGGCWLGRTSFCRRFFEKVLEVEPVPEAPDSEQGLLKRLLPDYPQEVALDYGTELFFNCGYVAGDMVAFEEGSA